MRWVLALLALPIVMSAAGRALGGWVPEGDDAWVARRTMQVLTTDPPLIGQESTSDKPDSPRSPNHPGPVAYYLVAVPYALSGWSPVGFVAGVAAVVAVAVGACVLLGSRVAGDRGAVAVGLAVALVMIRLGPNWTVRPLSSAIVLFPLVATLLGTWAHLRRDRVGLGVAVVAGSFCMQVSLVAMPLAAASLAWCGAVSWARARRPGPRPPRSRLTCAVVAAVALMWLPPVLDVALHWPGNLGELLHYLLGRVGLVSDRSAQAAALGIGPALASTTSYLTGLPGFDHQDLGPAAVELASAAGLGWLRLLGAASVVVGAARFARRRGSAALRSLGAVAAGAFAAGVVSLSQRPTEALRTQTYFAISVQAVIVVGWAFLVLAAIEAAVVALARGGDDREVLGRARRVPVRVAVGALAVATLSAGTGRIDRDGSAWAASLSRQVRAQVPPGTYVVVGEGFVPWISTAKGLGADLLAHGWDIRFVEFGGMEDETSRRGSAGLPQLVVTAERPDVAGPDVVARQPTDDRVLFVRYVPGGPLGPWCAAAGTFDVALRQATASDADAAADAAARLDAPEEWQHLLAGLDVGPLRRATEDPRLLDAASALRDGRAATLEDLAAGRSAEPSAEVRGAVATLARTYERSCGARRLPGAAAVEVPEVPR